MQCGIVSAPNRIILWVGRYEHGINWILRRSPGADKFVHINIGMALYLGTALLTRRRFGSRLPLAVVALAEAGNECVDRVAHGSWEWPDTLGDIAATLFWPCVLTIIFRLRRQS